MDRQQQEKNDAQQPSVDLIESQELVSEVKEQMQAESKGSTTEIDGSQESAGGSGTMADKEDKVDSRSVYVGNVDYFCTPEEVQDHFFSCGTINRVTILTDSYGYPKGYALVEFEETESVQNALLLNESELHGRQLRVPAKRTNVLGMSRGGWATPQFGFSIPDYFSPYGQFPRAGRYCRYRPY